LLINPDVILGHVPISEPLFEFAAAACTTDLVNFPHRFHRAIDILDVKPVSPLTITSRTEPHGKRFIVKADDLLTAFLSLERDAIAAKGANGNATRDGKRYVAESDEL
jgi:hypothetical protein